MSGSTDIISYYKRGWAEVQKHLVGWVVFYTAFLAVTLLTCGLGGVLYPNVMREVKEVAEDGGPPQLANLFRTDHIANDVINYLIYYAGMMVGSMAGGVGGIVAALLLQFQMPMAADDRYAPVDNAKLSLQHVTTHPADHLVFILVTYALVLPSMMLCMLPLPLVGPVTVMAHWLWYQDAREQLDAFAEDQSLPRITGPTG